MESFFGESNRKTWAPNGGDGSQTERGCPSVHPPQSEPHVSRAPTWQTLSRTWRPEVRLGEQDLLALKSAGYRCFGAARAWKKHRTKVGLANFSLEVTTDFYDESVASLASLRDSRPSPKSIPEVGGGARRGARRAARPQADNRDRRQIACRLSWDGVVCWRLIILFGPRAAVLFEVSWSGTTFLEERG